MAAVLRLPRNEVMRGRNPFIVRLQWQLRPQTQIITSNIKATKV
jgi:hypothetical protein